jgi:C1A family cysteine protease
LSASNTEAEIPAWVVENFRQWKSRHNRVYESAEVEIYRMAVFYSNFIYIQMENARQSDFELGENQFMDLTQDEWAAKYLAVFPQDYKYPTSEKDVEDYTVPNAEFSWLSEGVTGPILNQGSCGSCWAFSATETVQSFFAIKDGGAVPLLSEQQLVDCTTTYGNEGCNGGWPSYGLEYVKDYGQTTSSAYPYTGRDGTCKV